MNNSSTGAPSKQKAGSSQPSEASLKRKRGVFQKDLQHMMYGFGDDANVLLLGSITIEDQHDEKKSADFYRTAYVRFGLLIFPLCVALSIFLGWHIYLILQNKTTIGRPIDPYAKDFASHIGVLVCSEKNAPMDVPNWLSVPSVKKEKCFAAVLEKFDFEMTERRTQDKITQLSAQSQEEGSHPLASEEILSQVLPPDRPGRVKCTGRNVSSSESYASRRNKEKNIRKRFSLLGYNLKRPKQS